MFDACLYLRFISVALAYPTRVFKAGYKIPHQSDGHMHCDVNNYLHDVRIVNFCVRSRKKSKKTMSLFITSIHTSITYPSLRFHRFVYFLPTFREGTLNSKPML